MFEAVQFIELRGVFEPGEVVLGEFPDEVSAVEAARDARRAFMENGSADYAWWIVRRKGARLAEFIADSRSEKEFVLDLTSGQLLEV
ncbi:MAG: hypothetical protein ACE5F5_03555 [Acidimicrobiia bacterium]